MTDKHPGDPSECRSCQAPIVWTITANGKRMPCDIARHANGDFFLFRRADRIESIHRESSHRSAQGARNRRQLGHDSHFATCPNADDHRQKELL